MIETELILVLNNQKKTEFQAVLGVSTSASYLFKNVIPFLFWKLAKSLFVWPSHFYPWSNEAVPLVTASLTEVQQLSSKIHLPQPSLHFISFSLLLLSVIGLNRSQSEISAFLTLNSNFWATEEVLVPSTLQFWGDTLNTPRSCLCVRNGALVSEHFPGIGVEAHLLQHTLG